MMRGIAGVLRAGLRGCAGMAATLPALVAALPAGSAAAEPPARIQIVFDGSGSMWGKIPGDSGAKYAVAREALRQALPDLGLQRSTEVGLVLFGHRRRGDCGDVEQALAPHADDKQRLMAPLEGLNPKGRGPLALALVAAADALPGTGGRESVLLIHDDPDNCQGDPCAAAAELNRVRPRLAIHVVSIGMKPEDVERMACVPRITGGRHFDAQDAAAVGTAVGEALRLASLEAPEVAIRVPRPREATRQNEKGPPGLRLAAVLADGGEPLEEPVEWRVFRAGDASAAAVAEAVEASPRLALAPGTYVVEARRGLAESRQQVEVAAGRPTRATVVLNAGVVRLSPPFAGASTAAVVSLEERREGGAGDGRVLWLGPARDRQLVVPAGSYRLVLQDRQFRAERTIVVPSGSRGEPPLGSGAGRIRLQARDHAQAGQPADLVLFRILEDDPSAADGRREVARSATAAPQFTLPAGTYHLVARKGAAEIRELIALRPGDDVSRTLVLKLARLSLSARLPGATAPAVEKATFRVFRQDGQHMVARAAQPAPRLQLPAGRYRVEARLGRLNAVAAREVELKEGGDQELVIEPAAALVELKLAKQGGGAAGGDVFWEVRDGSSAVVWRTTAAEPREFLAAGRYTIRAESRERRAEKDVELRSGETRTIEVAFE
ncbi:MAG: hypothetical protein KJZ80_11290 [Hyphomicrobiaceae bacterium]|nr:hypothetical protein [Hyphomicrobiaceae bacterium]